MEIKRIQLRGISRSPSDRMTDDGGIAESLNAYLDHQEVAPAIVPKDITHNYLPDNVQAQKVFVHKLSHRENLIVVNPQNEIVFFEDKAENAKISLGDDEQLVDLTSIGNTVVISTNRRMLYMLYKKGEYIPLGDSIPKVSLGFVNVDQVARITDISEEEDSAVKDGRAWKNKTVEVQTANTVVLGAEGNDYRVTNEYGLEVLSKVWDTYQEMIGRNLNLGCFNSPVMIRYAVKLYDGSYLEASSPIMLGGALNNGELTNLPLTVYWKSEKAGGEGSTLFDNTLKVSLCYPYKIGIYKTISDLNLEDWKDIIQSIDVYITPAINLYPNGSVAARYESQEADADGYTRKIILDPANSEDEKNIEKVILSVGTFFKVRSFSLEEMLASSPTEFITLNGDMRGENISTNTQFSESLVSSEVIPHRMTSYNNSVISHGASVALSRGLPTLNGQCAHRDINETYNFSFRYYIQSSAAEDYVVYSKNIKSPSLLAVINPDVGTYVYNSSGRVLQNTAPCLPFAFLSYPDSRCYKVDICKVSESGAELGVCSLEMKPHPTVGNCSYAWLGLNKSLAFLEYKEESTKFTEMVEENRLELVDNKLFVSAVSNPFSFPIANRFTFQSPVLGTAVATIALSQGQFGQYPLYVFTKDGIWVMETASDGRFLSSKPLSREVCSNVDAITSIDNAVVFVTEKGLMLLSGSQVVNLSANMNGRHYRIEEHAKNILSAQNGFESLSDPLSDSTPFMAFMKKASIAYDYAGQRLICIAPDVDYQYVYKIDTQSWHKLFHGKTFVAPINSYPESLLLADEVRVFYWAGASSSFGSDMVRQQLKKYIPDITEAEVNDYLNMQGGIDVTDLDKESKSMVFTYLNDVFSTSPREEETAVSRIYNLSTHLDVSEEQKTERVVIATRPFDLDNPDVLKTIRDIRVRGQFPKGAVKFILQGSQDGITFYTISTLRGKSWKLFRLIILADIDATDRISWVDVGYETRFTNKLR